MSSFAQAMRLFGQMSEGGYIQLGRDLMQDLLNADGQVRFMAIQPFHDHVTRCYRFVLRENSPRFVRPGGRHLFYVSGPLLMRVKTTGTDRRPTPHMTVSLAEGLDWPGEAAKLNFQGEVVPRLGGVATASAQGQWRALLRLGETAQAIQDSDDSWANACHFDFPPGFDGSAAEALLVG